MPNLLTIHLSKTHVYYLLHNDYSSEQFWVSISWINTGNLTNVPKEIFQCTAPRNFIKFHKYTNIWEEKLSSKKFAVSKSLYSLLFKIHGQICVMIIKFHLVYKFCRKFSWPRKGPLLYRKHEGKKKSTQALIFILEFFK